MMLMTMNALANEKGNGGNTGVCFSDARILAEIKNDGNRISNKHMKYVTSVIPLDLYEARSKHTGEDPDAELVLPKEGETPGQYVVRIADRLSILPGIGTILTAKLNLISEDLNYYNAGGIDRIFDTNEAYYLDPEKCLIATAIRQTQKPTGDSKLEIDNRLFSFKSGSKMNRDLQGVLMLHETVLRWALDIGQKDAKQARELTAILIQKRLSKQSLMKALRAHSFLGKFTESLNRRFECNGRSYPMRVIAPPGVGGSDGWCGTSELENASVIGSTNSSFQNSNFFDPHSGYVIYAGSDSTYEYGFLYGAFWQLLNKRNESTITKEMIVGFDQFARDLQEKLGLRLTAKVEGGVVVGFKSGSVLYVYNLLSGDENPACAGGYPMGEIAALKRQIAETNVKAEALRERLSRSLFKKREIREQYVAMLLQISKLESELSHELKKAEAWNTCQENFKEMKLKHLGKLEAPVGKIYEYVSAQAQVIERQLMQQSVFSMKSKELIGEMVNVCESEIRKNQSFEQKCNVKVADFNYVWKEDPHFE